MAPGARAALDVFLQRLERPVPSGANDLIVAAPPWPFLVARLSYVELRAPRVTAAGHFERHRADRVPFRWQPVRVSEKELTSGLELHHRPVQCTSKAAQDLVAIFRGVPRHR